MEKYPISHLSMSVMRRRASLEAVGTSASSGVAENWGNLKFMAAANL